MVTESKSMRMVKLASSMIENSYSMSFRKLKWGERTRKPVDNIKMDPEATV
jgi:hypothetical protein